MKSNLAPKLRFWEFTDEWQIKKLSDILESIIDNRGKTPPVISSGIPLIETNALGGKTVDYSVIKKFVAETTFNSWFRKHLKDKDVLFSTVGQTGVTTLYSAEVVAGIAQNIVGLRANSQTSKDFLYYLLTERRNNNKFKQIEMIAVQPSVKVSQMINLKFKIPSKPEQEKIAGFLTVVDERVELAEKRVELLKKYKKGTMQKIFTQKIRFKDENGNPHPSWEEKALGEIVKFSRGSVLSKADLANTGRYKAIHYGELFTEYNEVISTVMSRTNLDTGVDSEVGDILMPTSDVTPQGLAKASVIQESGVKLGGDINILRPNANIDPVFLSYLLNHQKKKIMRIVSGATVRHVYSKDLAKIIYRIPESKQEQQKIANFLKCLDDKIKIEEEKLNQAKNFKKSLLQRMFV